MSLIKLEDVLHRIYSEPNTSDKLYQDINSLPQYNPEEVLREMIEESDNSYETYNDFKTWYAYALQDVLSRITKK